ncbi:MAG: phosphoribosylglycinamide formyltransferase [Rhodothalassiaceae bacterium]
MARLRLGVLISGRGSNLKALIEACRGPDYPAEVRLVISDRPGAPGLAHAREAGIEALVVDYREFADRNAFDEALHAALVDAGVELVCLAGFMRLLAPDFVNRWRNRLINIHPSLLPAYKGLRTHERVIEDGVRFTGCTVHFVRAEMDSGPVIVQAVVPVAPDDTPASLAARVLDYEHRIYAEAVRLIASGAARVSGSRVVIKDVSTPAEGLISPLPGTPRAP